LAAAAADSNCEQWIHNFGERLAAQLLAVVGLPTWGNKLKTTQTSLPKIHQSPQTIMKSRAILEWYNLALASITEINMNEYSQVPLAATLGRKWHSTTKIN
jgi:hypothetical protein